MHQRIQYLETPDGVHLAWAEAGRGPTLVKPSNWLTHLEMDWESPVWRHWMRFLAGHFRLIRYDDRGCGMTDGHAGDLSPARWLEDLEAVVDAPASANTLSYSASPTAPPRRSATPLTIRSASRN